MVLTMGSSLVQTALRITIAQRRLDDTIPEGQKHPTVGELAANIEGGDPENDGIGVTVSGENYVIQTYVGSDCELVRDGSCKENGSDCTHTPGGDGRVHCVSGWEPPVT